jgi:hypothetical protein
MAKIQETRSFPGKSAGDAYQAILVAAPKAGLQVWKRRDIAWLAMVRSGTGSDAIDGNISARGTQVIVSLSASSLSEADLKARAETVFQELQGLLK